MLMAMLTLAMVVPLQWLVNSYGPVTPELTRLICLLKGQIMQLSVCCVFVLHYKAGVVGSVHAELCHAFSRHLDTRQLLLRNPHDAVQYIQYIVCMHRWMLSMINCGRHWSTVDNID